MDDLIRICQLVCHGKQWMWHSRYLQLTGLDYKNHFVKEVLCFFPWSCSLMTLDTAKFTRIWSNRWWHFYLCKKAVSSSRPSFLNLWCVASPYSSTHRRLSTIFLGAAFPEDRLIRSVLWPAKGSVQLDASLRFFVPKYLCSVLIREQVQTLLCYTCA